MYFQLYTVHEFEISLICSDLITTVCSKDFNLLLVQKLKESPMSAVSMSRSLKVFMCYRLLMTVAGNETNVLILRLQSDKEINFRDICSLSSGLLHYVILWVAANILEYLAASTFRVN
jgi:hypothetical protein